MVFHLLNRPKKADDACQIIFNSYTMAGAFMTQIKFLILVFIGGGFGSITRYLLGKWISAIHSINFPLGTLVINIVACFILGLIVALADHKQLLNPNMRLFWAVGFCGGFSTFSAFSNETFQLLNGNFTFTAILYVVLSVSLCLLAIFLGIAVIKC